MGRELVEAAKADDLSDFGDFADSSEALRSRPNHWGKPWRRLNPPGGSLSRSVALTVSASEVLVV